MVLRNDTVAAIGEVERLKKCLEQAIERADLQLVEPSDIGYCELGQRLPVWEHKHPELAAYLKEKENGHEKH